MVKSISMMNVSQHINQGRLIETFTDLIRINSPSFSEREIGEFLKRRLEAVGCRVEFQEYDRSFNLMGFKKGNNPDIPPLLLSGHMDTIEPTEGIAFSIDDEAIRSTGNTVLGADDKSALAQIIEALMVINEKGLAHGDLEIVFTSAEETGLFGARSLDFSRLKSRHALILDSSGSVGSIVIAAPTHYTYEMKITGKAAHAGIEPEKGISAIRAAAKIISSVPDGRINPETTANIGVIKGGTATNVVPKEIVIKGEVRGHDNTVLEDTKKTILDAAGLIAGKEGVRLEVMGQEEYKAFRIDESEPFLRFLDSVYKGCGIEPVHTITGGGSDANIFNHRGIMAINISTGMQKVHSTEEHIYIKDLFNG
ncbi:MAG: M20/M25/M40 family metallo-hydrolase, partial [Deltaproteobacteria bacterium]